MANETILAKLQVLRIPDITSLPLPDDETRILVVVKLELV
jgi:hypothetical protein